MEKQDPGGTRGIGEAAGGRGGLFALGRGSRPDPRGGRSSLRGAFPRLAGRTGPPAPGRPGACTRGHYSFNKHIPRQVLSTLAQLIVNETLESGE